MTPDPTLIEQVAEIIDPHSFIDIPFTDDPTLLEMVEQSKVAALIKAERIIVALQGSAALPSNDTNIESASGTLNETASSYNPSALPSEAQIEAGADCLRQAGTRGLNAEEAAAEVYTAMRATTPTAPVQDDDDYCGIVVMGEPVQDDDAEWRPVETMPKGARVEGDLGGGQTIIGRTVPRSKFGDHNTVTDASGIRHIVYRWRPL